MFVLCNHFIEEIFEIVKTITLILILGIQEVFKIRYIFVLLHVEIELYKLYKYHYKHFKNNYLPFDSELRTALVKKHCFKLNKNELLTLLILHSSLMSNFLR